ncbi:MAG: UvrD-helicase domain-containing protein, partial [Bacteroidaceae bacterium]
MSDNRTFTVCRASAGTGKTFTLAARYIALLMSSDRDNLYRNILAVTFTNKATAEMKRRILSYLFIIAEGDENDSNRRSFVANVERYMSSCTQAKKVLSAQELREKAGRIYHKILADYDNMRVVTIDSFLQSLISGMAHSVGLGASFGVVLDSSQIVSEAVEELMTTHIGEYEGAEAALMSFVDEQLDEEKTWDIRKKIISLAGEIMKEAVQKDDDDIVFEADKINAYKKNLKKHYDTKLNHIRSLFNKVRDCEVEKEIKSGSNYYSFIRRIGASIDNTAVSKDFFRGLGQKTSDALENDKFLSKISGSTERATEIRHALIGLNEACQTMRQEWMLYKITVEHLNALMLMGYLKKRIDYKLNELNSILLGRTAYVLSKALKPGDADFILEKAGIRFRHIMIDEFQDTSVLQWEVFKELVGEILSSGGSTLVVGDVKQSIYRWRNGDYTIMENFSETTSVVGRFFDVDAERLSRNFRSRANVVKFNLRVFDRLSRGFASRYETLYKEDSRGYSDGRLEDFYDKEKKEGGYVRYRVYPCIVGRRSADTNDNQKTIKEKLVRQTIARQVFADISELIDKGASASDMLILIRYSCEVDLLVEAYNESGLQERGVLFSSNDSFRLETSLS